MRPLVFITVGYITGIIWGLYFNISIVPIIFLFGGVCLILLKSKGKEINYFNSRSLKINIIAFIIFAIISNIQIFYLEKKHNILYEEINNVEIIGKIVSNGEETRYQTKYTIEVESLNNDKKYNRTKLILYTKKDNALEYGDKVHIIGEYEYAAEATNYKLFDYREYLKEKNIYGIIKASKVNVLEKDNSDILTIFDNIREKVKTNLKLVLGEEAKVTIGILLRRHK